MYLLDFAPFGEKWTEPLAFEWADFDKDNKVDTYLKLFKMVTSKIPAKFTIYT